jgi:hypothetical protein
MALFHLDQHLHNEISGHAFNLQGPHDLKEMLSPVKIIEQSSKRHYSTTVCSDDWY